MAKKQRQEVTSTNLTRNKHSTTTYSQLDSTTDSLSWLDFPSELFTSGYNYPINLNDTSLISTDPLSLAEDFFSAFDAMNQKNLGEVNKCSSGASCTTEATQTGGSLHGFLTFPNQWFEVTNKGFLNTDPAIGVQDAVPGSSQIESSVDFHQLLSPEFRNLNDKSDAERNTQAVAAVPPSLVIENRSPVYVNPRTSFSQLMSASDNLNELPKQVKKKRSIDETVDALGDSDSDITDDGSCSDNEDDQELKINPSQFAGKFLNLRQHGRPCNFWQYNSQSRGPKGKRIYGEIVLKDCHVLDEFSDPVSHCETITGNKAASKLRHGEGNDPKPDAYKLLEIGARINQLEDKFKVIKSANKEDTMRQKNKLASRICRLKKKAQHEANKVKLEGLREEHEQLVAVVARLVTMMEQQFPTTNAVQAAASTTVSSSSKLSLCSQLENLIHLHLKFMIAGHTTEYVNMQAEKAAIFSISNRQIT